MQPPGCLLSKNWTAALVRHRTRPSAPLAEDPQGSVWETARRAPEPFPPACSLSWQSCLLHPQEQQAAPGACMYHSGMVTTAKKGRQRPSADDAHRGGRPDTVSVSAP